LALKGKCALALLPLLLIPLFAELEAGVASEVHDIAITGVTVWPVLTLPSYVNVNVTVENQGTSHETFNVTLRADNLTVASTRVIDLPPGSNETLKLKCDLFPYRAVIFPPPWSLVGPMIANVSVVAEASAVAGEADTLDNVCVGEAVSITWWCVDLNGDGRINILDLAIMAKAFGNGGFRPLWLDIDGDGQITILEIACVARAFGRVYFELPNSNSGTLRVVAWYATGSDAEGWNGSFVVIEVTVYGPHSTSGTTTTDRYNPLTLDLTPGMYTVSGTYNGVVKSVDVSVVQGEIATGILNFGGPLPPL
jgi:hypothetical protein